jgi:hypothetical protein
MSDLWWSEAARDALCPTTLTFTGGPPKGVLHTTEGTTLAAAVGAYRTANSWPHFTLTFEGGRFAASQHIALNFAARSLAHTAGAQETNRDGAIQCEIVWHAADAANMPLAFLAGIQRWMRWVETNAGVKRHAPVFKAYPASYGVANGVRMSTAQWDTFDGWCGHQHVPENDHGDPGAIDIAYLLPPIPSPVHLEDDMPGIIANDATSNYYIDGGRKVVLDGDSLAALKAAGVKDVGRAVGLVTRTPDA